MSVDLGPKLGLLINANIGEVYVDQFRPFLRAIDELLFGSFINSTTTAPPGSPANGDAYLLLNTPTGDWTGHQNSLAIWSTEITLDGTNTKVPGWEFRPPNSGWLLWDIAASQFLIFSSGAWSVYAGGLSPTSVVLAPTEPGNFTVAHGLSGTPAAVTIEMTSGGQIWFQTERYDATNLYLVASDSGLTGFAQVWE
jgi:hypothetical protein